MISIIPLLLIIYYGPIIVPESKEIKINMIELLHKDCQVIGFINK